MALFLNFRLSANTHTSAYPLLDSAIDLQKCCRCHVIKNRGEMSECVACGEYFCANCDCACPVREEESEE